MAAIKLKHYTTYCADLLAPDGNRSSYEVSARTKTEARQKVRQAYRENTPPPSCGFYAFEKMRLTWTEAQP